MAWADRATREIVLAFISHSKEEVGQSDFVVLNQL
jgi:hypothetical protein